MMMKKIIEFLTKEQEKQLEEYKVKWIKIGLDTNRSNKKKCNKAIKEVYKNVGLKPPKKIIWTLSPKEAIERAKELEKDIYDIFSHICYGQHESSWLFVYDYCLNVLGIKECKIIEPHMEIAKNCGWWLPFEDLVIVSEKPSKIYFKGDILHREEGAAIEYGDGFKVYALNDVHMPKEIVETSKEDIEVTSIIKEKNVEIRKEIVRKIGIERIMEEFGAKVIDKKGDYELLLLDIGDSEKRPYLKMKNPSLGTYHIEGVHPTTRTVKEALKFRNGTEEEPIRLS